jgi:hypothetical protein
MYMRNNAVARTDARGTPDKDIKRMVEFAAFVDIQNIRFVYIGI